MCLLDLYKIVTYIRLIFTTLNLSISYVIKPDGNLKTAHQITS